MPSRTRHVGLPAIRCKAHSSRTGEPCKSWAIRGGTVCTTHGGRAPQVKARAAQNIRDVLAEAIDPTRSLREAARLAYSDIRKLFDPVTGRLLPMKDWPADVASCVASVKTVKKNVTTGDGVVDDVLEIRLWDKTRTLEFLMKHHGQLTEKVEVSGTVDVVDRLAAGRKRIADARAAQEKR